MQPTRRGWALAAVSGLLVGLAWLLADPLVLLGAAAVAAWGIAAQAAALYGLRRLRADLEVTVDVDTTRPTVDQPVHVTLTASGAAMPAALTFEPPPGADVTGPTTLDLAEATSLTQEVRWPVAGTHTLGPPKVVVTDRFGLVVEAFEHPTSAAVEVQPHSPETVHLGRGGERIATFGEHQAAMHGSAIEPSGLRLYEPGDPAARIDWKATARLNEVYLKDAEATTDRRTIVLLDARETMAIGEAGRRPFDYARYAALAIIASARDLTDPLGLYAVGDDGVVLEEPPRARPDQYERVARALRHLEPTTSGEARGTPLEYAMDPAEATRAADVLADGGDPFAATLAPLFGAASPYVRRIEGRPLFTAARTYVGQLSGTSWTVLITDDADRAEVREAVKVARRGHDRVLVVLTPRALFEAGGLADLEAARRAYDTFEAFRRELANLERVDALELAPGDRLGAVLSVGRERR